MYFNFLGVKIFYRISGNITSKDITIVLHGWGCDGHIFDDLLSRFDRQFLIIDLPPFGESNVEPCEWNIFTYSNMVLSLCQKLSIKRANIIGHSFGGRIAIILAALNPKLIQKCVLIDSAGLRPKRSPKFYIKIYIYKLLKKMGFMFSAAGSSDYKQLSPQMKRVFVAIVNQYLDEYLPLIQQKTLIIFGENDKETPIYMAKRLHKFIQNSTLEILKQAGHFAFLDCPLSCFRMIDAFLEE